MAAADAIQPQGVKVLSLADDKDGERRRKSEPTDSATATASRARRRKRGESPEIGQALRSVYDRAVREDIPPEMLDLLGKLG